MSKLQVDDIVNKDDNGSVGFSRGAVVTGVTTTTTLAVTGVSTVGVLTAYSSVSVGGTNIITAIDGKTSPGKAIALSMVFG
mgnify:CR=1 FL=1|jgi:hypothetical protein